MVVCLVSPLRWGFSSRRQGRSVPRGTGPARQTCGLSRPTRCAIRTGRWASFDWEIAVPSRFS